MHNMIMKLKNGQEIKFACKTYELEKFNMGGGLLSFKYTGGVGECPVYFRMDDIETIVEIIDEDGEA